MIKWKKIREFFVSQRERYYIGKNYVGEAQFLLILLLVAEKYSKEFSLSILDFTILIFGSGLIIMWVLGYIEDKTGILRRQIEWKQKRNLFAIEMRKFNQKAMKKLADYFDGDEKK